jgi:hypothetical protein
MRVMVFANATEGRRNAPGDRTEAIEQSSRAIANFKSEVEEILRKHKKD